MPLPRVGATHAARLYAGCRHRPPCKPYSGLGRVPATRPREPGSKPASGRTLALPGAYQCKAALKGRRGRGAGRWSGGRLRLWVRMASQR